MCSAVTLICCARTNRYGRVQQHLHLNSFPVQSPKLVGQKRGNAFTVCTRHYVNIAIDNTNIGNSFKDHKLRTSKQTLSLKDYSINSYFGMHWIKNYNYNSLNTMLCASCKSDITIRSFPEIRASIFFR